MEKQKITITLLDVMEIDTCLNGAIDELTLQRKGKDYFQKTYQYLVNIYLVLLMIKF